MKSYYGLTQSIYIGSVMIQQETTSYTTAELRDIVRQHLENINTTLPNGFTVRYTEFMSEVYENTAEVPILQDGK